MPSIAPRPKIGQAPELTLGPSIDPTRLAMKVSTMSPVQTVNHVPGSNPSCSTGTLACVLLTDPNEKAAHAFGHTLDGRLATGGGRRV